MRFGTPFTLAAMQIAAAVVALVALPLWPPSSGELLLVPLPGSDPHAMVGAALAAGARLLGTGPFPNSLVVVGDRSGIAGRVSPWRVLITAAPPAGCGTGRKDPV